MSFSVKDVRLELVSDLTSHAFIAALRRFIARCGKPSTMWSDNGSNFVSATHALKELFEFASDSMVQGTISEFCSSQKYPAGNPSRNMLPILGAFGKRLSGAQRHI